MLAHEAWSSRLAVTTKSMQRQNIEIQDYASVSVRRSKGAAECYTMGLRVLIVWGPLVGCYC